MSLQNKNHRRENKEDFLFKAKKGLKETLRIAQFQERLLPNLHKLAGVREMYYTRRREYYERVNRRST